MPDVKIILTKTEDIKPAHQHHKENDDDPVKFYTLEVLALENFASWNLVIEEGGI